MNKNKLTVSQLRTTAATSTNFIKNTSRIEDREGEYGPEHCDTEYKFTYSDYRCRICLSEEDTNLMRLSCRCDSENGFVHEECFEGWIFSNKKTNINEPKVTNEVQCERCEKMIMFNQKMGYKCHPLSNMKKKYKILAIIEGVLLLIAAISLMVLGATNSNIQSHPEWYIGFALEIVLIIQFWLCIFVCCLKY